VNKLSTSHCSVRLKHFRQSSYRECFYIGEKSIRDWRWISRWECIHCVEP